VGAKSVTDGAVVAATLMLLLVVVLLSPVVVLAGATLGFMAASGLWH
jgi:hypothetical protein